MTQNPLMLVQQRPLPREYSLWRKENFEFFEAEVQTRGSDLTALCQDLTKLVIVDIALSHDQDNPQLIIESMKSTGRALSQADLIRNFILMGLEPAHQTRHYEDYWRPMEMFFGQEAYGAHFDAFMRHYLTLKTGEIPNVHAVYEAFKTHAHPEVAADGGDASVADIHDFAGYYCAMALSQEPDKELADAFQDLRELKVDVAYPFLLESSVFRSAICSIPTNSLNKTFTTFRRALKKDCYLESIQTHLLPLPSYRRFPVDEKSKRALAMRVLYSFPRRSSWLWRLENHDRKERIPVDEYTIERSCCATCERSCCATC